jgi:hypothetical protein
MMQLSNEEYINRLKILFNKKQENSFELRLPYVAERRKYGKTKILHKVFLYYDAKWSHVKDDFITFNSEQEYFSFAGSTELLSHVVFRLYNSSYLGEDEEYLKNLRIELSDFYKKDKHYDFLLFVLSYIREEGNPLLITEFFNNLLDILITRLIDYLKELNVASEGVFYTINHFTEFSFSYYIWREYFLNYLCTKDNYIVWFYNIFTYDTDGKVVYNNRIKHAMLPGDGSYYIDGLLKQHNDDKKLIDLKMLVSNHQDIKSCSLSEHPFLEGFESYLKEHASENV